MQPNSFVSPLKIMMPCFLRFRRSVLLSSPKLKVVLKDQPAGGIRTKTYIIEGLDCANCAAKLERRINEMDEVDEAVLTFATKQLRISAQNPDRILPKIREVCVAMEPEVTIHEKERTRSEATKEKSPACPKRRRLLSPSASVLFSSLLWKFWNT